MRNAEFVRNVRIFPTRSESNTFHWGVDLAIPHKNLHGEVHYTHISEYGEAKSFAAAHDALVAYVESV